MAHWSKWRSQHWYITINFIWLYLISSVFLLMPFFCPRIYPGLHLAAMSPLVCDSFLPFSSSFWPWHFWKLVKCLGRMPLIWTSLVFFSWLDCGYTGFGEKYHISEVAFLSHHIRGTWLSYVSGFSTVKLQSSPLHISEDTV